MNTDNKTPQEEINGTAPQAQPEAPAEARASQAGTAPAAAPEKAGKKKFNANKWKRGGMATLLSVVFIAIVVAVSYTHLRAHET